MKVVLNEIKYAEDIINNNYVDKKVSTTIALLARYYTQVLAKTKAEAINIISKYIAHNYVNENEYDLDSIIKSIVSKCDKYHIRNIDHITITEAELHTIKQCDDIHKEKLLFTLLCFAKMYNLSSDTNNNWTNLPISELYKIARVYAKGDGDKYYILHDLMEEGYIKFSNKNTNLNIQVTFVNDNSEEALVLYTLEELGYEYMNYYSLDKFCRCKVCHKLIKAKNHEPNRQYCDTHNPKNAKKYKIINCIDCGKPIELNINNKRGCRCAECQAEKIRQYDRERKQNAHN